MNSMLSDDTSSQQVSIEHVATVVTPSFLGILNALSECAHYFHSQDYYIPLFEVLTSCIGFNWDSFIQISRANTVNSGSILLPERATDYQIPLVKASRKLLLDIAKYKPRKNSNVDKEWIRGRFNYEDFILFRGELFETNSDLTNGSFSRKFGLGPDTLNMLTSFQTCLDKVFEEALQLYHDTERHVHDLCCICQQVSCVTSFCLRKVDHSILDLSLKLIEGELTLKNVPCEFYLSCFSYVGAQAQRFPTVSSKSRDILLHSLSHPPRCFVEANNAELNQMYRICIAERYAHCTKKMKQRRISDEIVHLNNICCSLAKKGDFIFGNLLYLVGRMSIECDSLVVAEVTIPLFVQQLHDKTCSDVIAATIVDSLGTIAENTKDLELFIEIVEALAIISRRSSFVHKPRFFGLAALRNVTHKQMEIANKIVDSGTILNDTKGLGYLRVLVLLFVEKCGKFLKNFTDLGDDALIAEHEVIWLLEIIASMHDKYLCIPNKVGEMSFPDLPNDLLRLYRSLWSYSVLLGLDENNCWKPMWKGPMKRIAISSPYLLRAKAASYIEMEIQADASIIASGLKDQEIRLKSMLENLIGNQHDFSKLGVVPVLFLLAIFHCEILNLDKRGIKTIYSYCSDMSRSTLKKHIFALSDLIVQRMQKQSWGKFEQRELAVVQVKECMLLYPVESLYQTMVKHLETLMFNLPFTLFDTELLELALEILQVLFVAYNHEILGVVNYDYEVRVDKSVVSFQICRGINFRKKLLITFRKFIENWLQKASEKSSGEMVGAIQAFFGKFRQLKSQFPVHIGYQTALEFAISKNAAQNMKGVSINQTLFNNSSFVTNAARFMDLFGLQSFHKGGIDSLHTYWSLSIMDGSALPADSQLSSILKKEMINLIEDCANKTTITEEKFYYVFHRVASALIKMKKLDLELLHSLVWTPVQIFTAPAMRAAIDSWTWLLAQRPSCEIQFLNDSVDVWEWSIRRGRGIFSQKYPVINSLTRKIEYGPTKKPMEIEISYNYFLPHLLWIDFLWHHYTMYRLCSEEHVTIYLRMIQSTIYKRSQNSSHPLARLCYFKLWLFSWNLIHDRPLNDWYREISLQTRLYTLIHGMLSLPVSWNGIEMKFVSADILVLHGIYKAIKHDIERYKIISSNWKSINQNPTQNKGDSLIFMKKMEDIKEMQNLALIVLEFELHRLMVWHNPSDDPKKQVINDDKLYRERKDLDNKKVSAIIKKLWKFSPRGAIQVAKRFNLDTNHPEISELVHKNAFLCSGFPEAIPYLVNEKTVVDNVAGLKYLPFWNPVTPITAISYFLKPYQQQPSVLQFALRSLDRYPPKVVFFYVPQIVQALRSDSKFKYVEQFILQTARSSQIFAHQIIWNINANMYREYIDEQNNTVDRMKPILEGIRSQIIRSLSGEDKDFYEREFEFFEKITGISGKLKPYIRRPKHEKKEKIDEELKMIDVDPGVYLPSNPESIVLDIDYTSGRPLQSHAKAPYMATFKIKKAVAKKIHQKIRMSYESLYMQDESEEEIDIEEEEESLWQSAIFKVGDDCRQDVLALQLIAIFKTIYGSVGLDLFLFPYRIVATAPGCGVIEVVPNSVSRDQMGRSSVNDLSKWFLAKYGHKNAVAYQKARDSFIRSLAAYSVILYILQIKDRHNGNVLIDDAGHMIHIDFGFIFDIVPGGVKFELSPFKLTEEMIEILGGDKNSEHYKRFVDLCVRSFLACRPYAENIIQMVQLMLDSGLPCFTENTIQGLRSRFQLSLSEREAAEYMKRLVSASHRAWSTYVYDGYQKLTNGIPF